MTIVARWNVGKRPGILVKLAGVSAGGIHRVREMIDCLTSLTLPSRLGVNPRVWMFQANEFMMDVRHAPRLDDELVDMKIGEFVKLPAHKKHRVEWTTPAEPTIWLAVGYGTA